MKQKNRIPDLLDKLHKNKLSKEQSAYLFSIFRDENPTDSDGELIEFYLSKWENSTATGKLPQSERIWKKTKNRLGIQSEKPARRLTSVYQWPFVRYAAVFIIAFAMAWMLHEIIPNQNGAGYPDQDNTVISVSNGSKSDIRLPDGSLVKLNSGSTLSYPSHFEGDSRTVNLEGEGFFTIRKDPARPLYVNTTKISVKVLGTVLNIKSYADENTIETTLVSGAVEIYDELKANGKLLNEKPAAVLKPNDRATYFKDVEDGKIVDRFSSQNQKQTNLVIDKLIDAESYIAWKDNILKFDNERFDSIIRKLERWYGVKIDLKYPKLNDERFSGQFDLETVEQALKAIALTEPFAFDIKKNTVTIYQK